MDDAADQCLHVVVFPWLAFGHIIPFLELSKSIAGKGHKVSFLSTPRNLKRMPKIPATLAPFIDLVELHLPPVDGLPEGAEATTDLSPHEGGFLKIAYDGLEDKVVEFLRDSMPKPDWVIYDFASHWLPEAAAKAGVPCIFFSSFPASACVFSGPPSELIKSRGSITRKTPEDFTKPPKWVTFPSSVAYKLYQGRGFLNFYRDCVSGLPDSSRVGLSIEKCQAVAIRSCHELEQEWLQLLQKIYGKPVIPVGFLPPLLGEPGAHESEAWQWLDNRKPKSVLYVALGSEPMLSVQLLQELALGLELSHVTFLWALRKPLGEKDGVSLLPDGFEDRTAGRGLVVMDWVPQLNVLAHESVGGFLTHAGLNSLIEGLLFGHPLVSLPLFADQGLNTRGIVEKGVGVEVERNEVDGSFTKEDVAKSVRSVMVEGGGNLFRIKAEEMSKIFGDRELHDKYVDGLVQYMRTHGSGSD